MKPYQPTNPDRPVAVGYEGRDAVVLLANGEVLRTPLSLHPWLEQATPEQRANMEFDGHSVYWPDMDDGLDVEWMRRENSVDITVARVPSDEELLKLYHALDDDPKAQLLFRMTLGVLAERLEPVKHEQGT